MIDFKKELKVLFKDKYNLAFLAILITAIFLRLRYFFIESVWTDEALYGWYGYQILHNPAFLFSEEFAKVVSYLPSLVSAFFNIFTNSFFAGKLMTLIFGVFGIILIYLLGTELKDKFVGLLATIMLSFNSLYWFLTNRILLDVPLTTMFTLTAFCLIKYEKTKTKFWFIFLMVSSALTIYTKSAGILILPFLALYFILTYRTRIFSLLKRKEVWIGILVFLMAISFFVIINITHFGGLTAHSLKEVSATIEISMWEPIKTLPFILTWYTIPFLILGLLFSLIYRKKEHFLLLSWLVVFLGFFTFVNPNIVPRYLIPIVPAAFLISALAISELRVYIKKIGNVDINQWIVVAVILLLMVPAYIQGNNLVKSKSYTYTGFKEAGEWLKLNTEPDATIFTDSTRTLRLFSGKEFGIYGGELERPAKEKKDFEEQLKKEDLPVYLVVDVWEYIQPGWMYPLSQEKLGYIQSLGFELMKVVEKPYPTPNGLINQPVVFILKKIIR